MNARTQCILDSVKNTSIAFPEYSPQGNGKPNSEIFGEYVFDLTNMSTRLPKPVFQSYLKQIKGGKRIDKTTADAIAHAVRIWATEKGATHFTHWFQPQTDSTAEKHDAFLSLKPDLGGNGGKLQVVETLSGSQLLQSEPDASSFPSGGMRTTFEARGYTIWDTTSPMFIKPNFHNSAVLYIPCVYISYNGDALDQKTILLRSTEAMSKVSCELLNLLNPVSAGQSPFASKVYTTLGTEQEFFLVDKAMSSLRPDLKITGRTLIGNLPPKHQQLEDHYFGKIPTRVMEIISEAEKELYKLGVPVKTRHNEVAPGQFEMAPVFEEASVAVDHNLLTMDALNRVATKKQMHVLFHEKPFHGMNGSGKHCNWSLCTDKGENLLEPTIRPESNYTFLLFTLAVLDALHQHGGLLRASIASASNDHRLGGHEAPPGIITAFLGEHVSEALNCVEENRDIKTFSRPSLQTIKVGGTILDLKLATLPNIDRDLTDRNRTSPFAFTGNKFEFRAVGSKQSPSFPVSIVNACVTKSIKAIIAALKKAKGNKDSITDEDKLEVIREYIKKTKAIRFEGDNYSDDWNKEAVKRGLPVIPDSLNAFQQLLEPNNVAMLTDKDDGIFTLTELKARYHILMERYSKDILVEADTLKMIINQYIIPSTIEYRKLLADSMRAIKEASCTPGPEKTIIDQLSKHLNSVYDLNNQLDDLTFKLHQQEDIEQQAKGCKEVILPLMEKIREHSDCLEELISNDIWSLPKYHELLFL